MDFEISMQRTASSAWILGFRCSGRRRLHGFWDFDAADGVVCMDFGISMQRMVSSAWISLPSGSGPPALWRLLRFALRFFSMYYAAHHSMRLSPGNHVGPFEVIGPLG